jgi:hypothetical protein
MSRIKNFTTAASRIKMSLFLLIALPSAAHAYTDPGSGLLLWQMLGSFFIGLIFYGKRLIASFKKLFGKNDQR